MVFGLPRGDRPRASSERLYCQAEPDSACCRGEGSAQSKRGECRARHVAVALEVGAGHGHDRGRSVAWASLPWDRHAHETAALRVIVMLTAMIQTKPGIPPTRSMPPPN